MAELIDRKELRKFPIRIDHYDKENGSLDFVLGIETVFEYIEYLPAIEAKPVVHAHWEEHLEYQDDHFACWSYSCSNCNELLYSSWEHSKYCSHCGAQMDELVSNTDELKCSEKPNSSVKIPVISMEDVPKIMEEKE